jgi:perosamine synthetase
MSSHIPYTVPSITELEVAYATDAARNGWGEACYDYIERFEEAFSQHLHVRHAIATSSCTGAMHLGLAGLRIGSGDEVILAETNWIATVAPIIHAGATPVLVDVCSDTWCIDPSKIEEAITPRTRAVVATHLYGNLAELDHLRAIVESHDIFLIEDAAEAIGSVYRGQAAGSVGHFGTFSFHGSKTVTTGEGGMFVTNDEELYSRVLSLSNHGRDPSEMRYFMPHRIGFKFKMSNLQAAIGCAQMERIDELVVRKQEILDLYRRRLNQLPGATMNVEQDGCVNGAWMPTVRLDGYGERIASELGEALQLADVDARPFFPPLSSLDMFDSQLEHAVAYRLAKEAINLPSFHAMTEDQFDRVCSVVEVVAGSQCPRELQ